MTQRIGFLLLVAICGAGANAFACATLATAQDALPLNPQANVSLEVVSGRQDQQTVTTKTDLPAPPAPNLANQPQDCIQPAPMVRIEDYQGPFAKVVGTFAGRLERRTVHQPQPHFKAGVMLCTLPVRDKFMLFVADSTDPVTFLGAAFYGGIDQAENSDRSYGQGVQGYGKRFGAELAGQATATFFMDFAYPSLFSEDPRYYRMAYGPVHQRLLHALAHSFVAHRDNGTLMPNFSEWLGMTSTVVVNNTYHPDYHRGVGPNAERVGFGIAQDAGFNVLREFWPEVARKLKLPFRGQSSMIDVKPTALPAQTPVS